MTKEEVKKELENRINEAKIGSRLQHNYYIGLADGYGICLELLNRLELENEGGK